MLLEVVVFAIILMALALGFFFGYRAAKKKYSETQSRKYWPVKHYHQGLTYLLNDEPDAAIDTFISALDVNKDTLETHLALGNLLRRRGEVARAIKVHQNLLARPSLSKAQLHMAQLELAVDYLRAGLIDRAETLLGELVDTRGVEKQLHRRALQFLLEVFQGTREWLKAIDIADRLTSRKFAGAPDKWRQYQAHYCCELAEDAIIEKDWLSARRQVRAALRHDKNCVRASLIQARLYEMDGDLDDAFSTLKKIPQQDPRHISEMFEPLWRVAEKKRSLSAFKVVAQHAFDTTMTPHSAMWLAKAIEECDGTVEVVRYLKDVLAAYPRMEVALRLLNLIPEIARERPSSKFKQYAHGGAKNTSTDSGVNDAKKTSADDVELSGHEAVLLEEDRSSSSPTVIDYEYFKPVLEKLFEIETRYECGHCGFHGAHMHWLCPSCKHWNEVVLV